MRVYIAGPMRGHPDWNRGAFQKAVVRWMISGDHPINPTSLVEGLGYSVDDTEVNRSQLEHVITVDVACIVASEAIAVLPGWEKSYGATVEVALAQFLGMPIYDAVTMERITVLSLPWQSP